MVQLSSTNAVYIPLPRSFFERPTKIVAKELLGKRIVRRIGKDTILSGFISEVEAYLGKDDEASHAFKGETLRNRALFKKAGLAYLHRIHQEICLDVTTETVGHPTSILIRGIIPDIRTNILTNGPGKLTRYLNIGMDLYETDLTSQNSPLFISKGLNKIQKVGNSERVGINKAKDLKLRFYIKKV